MRKSMTCLLAFVLACLLGSSSARAATYYVAVNGSTTGNGSLANPWPSVNYALAHIPVPGGSTVIVEPGTYTTGIYVTLNCAGSQANPTIIRSAVKWGAIIQGASQHGIYSDSGCNWLTIDGFQVTGSGMDGIKICYAKNCVVRNCWSHNNTHQGISSYYGSNTLIENNLIEHNGTTSGLDHGIYASGDSLTVRNNVVRYNLAYGLQFWPSISNTQVYNNLVYGQSNKGGIVFGSTGNNVFTNNTVVDNLQALVAYGPLSETITNNIFTAYPLCWVIGGTGNFSNMYMDYNICYCYNQITSPLSYVAVMRTAYAMATGSHGRYANPKFVASSAGAYYLGTGSPAINAASLSFSAHCDFWDLAQPTGPISTGAFPYMPAYATQSFTNTIMDYWVLPPGN